MALHSQWAEPTPCRAAERFLASYAPLGDDELVWLRARLTDLQSHGLGAGLHPRKAGDQRPHRLVLSGWIGWTAELHDGRRQIISLGLTGDLLDRPQVADLCTTYVALTAARTADASALLAEIGDCPFPALARAWALARRATEARRIRHVVRLGRLSALERTASLLLELYDRQRRAGLTEAHEMPLPLTQEMLSDLLGLSAVHVNRVLQQLRREGFVATRAGRVRFPDLPGIALLAGTEPVAA